MIKKKKLLSTPIFPKNKKIPTTKKPVTISKKIAKRTPKAITKDLDLAKNEFTKICTVLGMETLELYKNDDLSFEKIEFYAEKALTLQTSISELIEEKEN